MTHLGRTVEMITRRVSQVLLKHGDFSSDLGSSLPRKLVPNPVNAASLRDLQVERGRDLS